MPYDTLISLGFFQKEEDGDLYWAHSKMPETLFPHILTPKCVMEALLEIGRIKAAREITNYINNNLNYREE